LARKVLHQAVRDNRKGKLEALPLYEQAWPLWVDVCLRHPRFAQVGNVQEEVYDAMLNYMRSSQTHNGQTFRTVNLTLAQMAIAPHPILPRPANWNWAKGLTIVRLTAAHVVQHRIED